MLTVQDFIGTLEIRYRYFISQMWICGGNIFLKKIQFSDVTEIISRKCMKRKKISLIVTEEQKDV